MKIETWDFDKFCEYVGLSAMDTEHKQTVQGFTLVNSVELAKLNETTGHKVLVALEDSLVGVFICEWIDNYGQSFGRYSFHTIDVHKNHFRQGIGTALVKALDAAQFLKTKIFQLGIYSDNGRDYIRHVVDEELKARDYALIPASYRSMNPPQGFGKFDNWGRLIS